MKRLSALFAALLATLLIVAVCFSQPNPKSSSPQAWWNWITGGIGGVPAAVQSTTPGTAQTGNDNLTGTRIGGAFATADGYVSIPAQGGPVRFGQLAGATQFYWNIGGSYIPTYAGVGGFMRVTPTIRAVVSAGSFMEMRGLSLQPTFDFNSQTGAFTADSVNAFEIDPPPLSNIANVTFANTAMVNLYGYMDTTGCAAQNGLNYTLWAQSSGGKIPRMRWDGPIYLGMTGAGAPSATTTMITTTGLTTSFRKGDDSGDANIRAANLIGANLQLPHAVNKVASANIRNSYDAVATSTALVYTKTKTITLTNGLVGQQRFLFDIKTAGGGATAYGKIYRNGVALGTEQTDVTGGYVTKSEDLTQTWNPGDTCELWVYTSDGAQAVSVQNFRIAYDDSPTVAVASANSTP